jgi:hypothetical protein
VSPKDKTFRVVRMPERSEPAQADPALDCADALESLAAEIRSGKHTPSQMMILFLQPEGARTALWTRHVNLTHSDAIALLTIAQRFAIDDWIG